MYKKYKRSKFNNYKKDVRKNIATEAYEEGKFYNPPTPEKVGDGSELLQKKAYRDLNNLDTGVIEVKADPNSEMSYGQVPYTIIGQTSPVVDAKYPGSPNIAGNSIVMLQNDTTKSQLMNTVDVGIITKKMNYLYAPISSDSKNTAVADEIIKTIESAVSYGFSTMLTQLPFATATYASDIVIPTAQTGKNAAGYYSALMHYQTVLQDLVTPISKYIELRSLEKELLRMSFRTEAPLVTQLFGLYKKSSFISEINTIGTTVLNEYFDVNWYKQMNTLLCVPSRKTNGMVDPLLTLIGVHKIPSLTIDSYYDSSSVLTTDATLVSLNPDTLEFETGAVSLENLIIRVCKLLNPAYILRFLRLMNQGALPTDGGGHTYCRTISAYGEATKIYLSAISRIASAFSTNMSDVRTFLDKLGQSNMVYWNKGVSFFVDKITQLRPHYNALLNDVFQATFAGADTIKYDNNTKRWRAWALWNKYTGIPEFDRVSGGSFLTFGLRDISSTDTDGNAVDFNSSSGLFPILFIPEATVDNLIVTRRGANVAIRKKSLTNANVQADHQLTRLNALNNGSISLKEPLIQINLSGYTTAEKARFASTVLEFMGNVFGFGVTANISGTPETITVVDTTLDPDYVAFIDLEIEDVSNQMITFARNYSPFRTNTPNGKREIGFIG